MSAAWWCSDHCLLIAKKYNELFPKDKGKKEAKKEQKQKEQPKKEQPKKEKEQPKKKKPKNDEEEEEEDGPRMEPAKKFVDPYLNLPPRQVEWT